MTFIRRLLAGWAIHLALMAALFVTLKLTGVIVWSWWWVTIPLWIGPAFVMALILGFGLIFLALSICG